jgi:hypothetical protein
MGRSERSKGKERVRDYNVCRKLMVPSTLEYNTKKIEIWKITDECMVITTDGKCVKKYKYLARCVGNEWNLQGRREGR